MSLFILGCDWGPGGGVPFRVGVINAGFGDGGDRVCWGLGRSDGVGTVGVHVDIISVDVGLKVNHQWRGRVGGVCAIGESRVVGVQAWLNNDGVITG